MNILLFLASLFSSSEPLSFSLIKEEETSFASWTKLNEKELETLFEKPFTFLGEGNQSLCFLSSCKSVVLKIFKLRSDRSAQEKERKSFHQMRPFIGYTLAYERLDDPNLLLVSLQKEQAIDQIATLQGPFFSQEVRTKEIYFILQRKGEKASTLLHALLMKGDVEGAKDLLQKLLLKSKEELDKGVFDEDRNILHNMGFIDGEAFKIDYGKLTPFNTFEKKREIIDSLKEKRIQTWLRRHFPLFEKEIMEGLKTSEEDLFPPADR